MTETMTERAAPQEGRVEAEIQVWDPLVRIFHWSLVGAFTLAWLTADEWQTTHEIAGYVVAGLVAFRLVWGLVGSRYARFGQFLRGPAATLGYLRAMLGRRERRYLGHNPVGAAMIAALLFTLLATAFTGWLMEDPDRIALLPDLPQIVAPAYADEGRTGGSGEDALEEVHEALANLLLLLVALHVAGVLLASFRHRENLARAMVTGDKRAPSPGDVA
ncbi:cytochrome b/b6 domain-containing protein [Roseovarius sp. S4756]|uniref:cytochrome b/b6 domain-containing protein n=1 Tax=Roseovarius maritimus TaxID=3342637 RepID=UPI003729E083